MDEMNRQINNLLRKSLVEEDAKEQVSVYSNAHSFSAMIGHKACNRKQLEKEWPKVAFSWKQDHRLQDNRYRVCLENQ